MESRPLIDSCRPFREIECNPRKFSDIFLESCYNRHIPDLESWLNMTRAVELHAIESITVRTGHALHVPLHRHQQMAEWLWVESGELELMLTSESLTLSAGTLVLIPPGTWCGLSFSSGSEQRCKKLLVTHPAHSRTGQLHFSDAAHPGFLASLIEELRRELQKNSPASSKQAQLLLGWLYGAAIGPADQPHQHTPSSHIGRILHHMEETCHLPFSLDAIAAEAGLSKFHFSRHFKEMVGQTPLQFAISCRMDRARQLLLDTEETVPDIAGLCGYKSATQFHAAFTRHAGITPKRFRQQQYVEADR